MPRSPDLPSVALPTDKQLILKVVPMPGDCNANGDIFGGWVMSQVDLAGCTLAMRLAGGRMATVAVKEFVFKHPIRVGDVVSLYGCVTRVGRTSVTVDIEVFAERMSRQGEYVKVTEAVLTYVAIDAEGNPRAMNTPAPAEEARTSILPQQED